MAVLEVETFSLNQGVEPSRFRALDEQMQQWCYLNRPGLARRTTAHDDDGSYVVVTLFGDRADAVAIDPATAHPVVEQWTRAISGSTRTVRVYSLL